MKLYYSPGACSLSPHIVLRESGAKFDLVKTDIRGKKTESGGDFLAVNARGYVPVLELDNGEKLTEGPAIVQYLADLKPDAGLAPKSGTMERYRLQEWLNMISSELHKGFSPLFNPNLKDDAKAVHKERLVQRLDWLDKQLAGKEFLMGTRFTVADAYAFTVVGWTKPTGIGLDKWPSLKAYHERIAKRPAVQAAMKAEGLIK
jgi:glutathione S-transferase